MRKLTPDNHEDGPPTPEQSQSGVLMDWVLTGVMVVFHLLLAVVGFAIVVNGLLMVGLAVVWLVRWILG